MFDSKTFCDYTITHSTLIAIKWPNNFKWFVTVRPHTIKKDEIFMRQLFNREWVMVENNLKNHFGSRGRMISEQGE